MIRFGSRVDLYFENYKPLVKLEQRAVAGETLIARKVAKKKYFENLQILCNVIPTP